MGPREALDKAISISRNILDNPDNWSALGYSGKPIMYAVKSLHTDVDIPVRLHDNRAEITILTKVASFSEGEIAKLRSLEDVPIAYRVMHVDDG